MFRWLKELSALRTDRRIRDLQAQIDEKDRLIAVLRAETESLAGVIARDRARVAAEMAAYNRDRAQSEGVSDERDRQSPRRLSA